jgi:hypothetical protein
MVARLTAERAEHLSLAAAVAPANPFRSVIDSLGPETHRSRNPLDTSARRPQPGDPAALEWTPELGREGLERSV